MNLHEHLTASISDPEHKYDLPLEILLEAWDELVKKTVGDDGRHRRNKSQSRARRSSGTEARERAEAAISAVGLAVMEFVSADYFTSDLLGTEFPVERGGEVIKLRDFSKSMVERRLIMLKTNAAGIVEDIAMLERANDLMSATGASTVGEAVRLASA